MAVIDNITSASMTDIARAAGMYVYRVTPVGGYEFLLLQASKPPFHWGPPKGHVDPGEDDFTAAIRETEEETGIKKVNLNIHNDCPDTLTYKVETSAAHPEDNGKVKTVKFWLAGLRGGDVGLSDEHQNTKWAGLEEAVKLVNFPQQEALLRKFHAYLTMKN